MKHLKKLHICLQLLLSLALPLSIVSTAFAQTETESSPAEIAKAKAAVEKDFNSEKTHQAYIKATGLTPALAKQYDEWIAAHPKNTVIPMAIGVAYCNRELPEAEKYLKKVVEIDPANATAWYQLSIDAERWGKHDLSIEYLKKASEMEPQNPDYAFYYTSALQENLDAAAYRKTVDDLVKRFPKSERGAQALYWIAERSTNEAEKIAVDEQLKSLYPPKQFNWAGYGMVTLYDAYIKTNPNKALTLAKEMAVNDAKSWTPRVNFAMGFLQADSLAAAGKYNDGVLQLNGLKIPVSSQLKDFLTAKKAGLYEKAGNTAAAYKLLITDCAKMPNAQLVALTNQYGKKLNKDAKQVIADVKAVRDSAAKNAPDFTLGLYSTADSLSIAKLRGKVILLTFWFPGCGPCRGEFPHFQAVIDKYAGKDVVYLGINVLPQQDAYVLPFMQNSKYSFIPLHGTQKVQRDYAIMGAPSNYLIDKNGKIAYRDFRINENNHESLEIMINSLL